MAIAIIGYMGKQLLITYFGLTIDETIILTQVFVIWLNKIVSKHEFNEITDFGNITNIIIVKSSYKDT